MITPTQVGQNVRYMREQNKLTQKALAERLSYRSPQFVSDIERGKFLPKLVTLAKLGVALGCTANDLLSPELSTSTVNLDDLEPETDSETLSSLETAKTERAVIQEMQFEDAELEMQTTALERLAEQVQTYGKRNRFQHKQLRDVVLVAGVLLELAEDVSSNDEPSAITESRALELLEALK
jgi:transcriptional regulator with XRE-family HTH domain